MPERDEWIPHAELEFGRFTKTLSRNLPAKLTQLRRAGKLAKAMTSTQQSKLKR